MSASRKDQQVYLQNQEPVWLPDEVWMSILHFLISNERLKLRLVNKNFKRLAEARGAWDKEFLTTAEVINIEKLIQKQLALRLENSKITKKDYDAAIKQLNAAKNSGIVSHQIYKEVENVAISKRANVFSNEFLKGKTFLTYFYLLLIITEISCSTVLLISQGLNGPKDKASGPYCHGSDSYAVHQCQLVLSEALKLGVSLYFSMGALFGSLFKIADHALSHRVASASAPLLFPSPSEELKFSTADKIKQLLLRAFYARDYIGLVCAAVTAVSLFTSNPFECNVAKYLDNQSLDKHVINQNQLTADIVQKTKINTSLSITDGFLLAYVLHALCVLVFGVSKRLTTNCHSFFCHRDSNQINEEKPLIHPEFKKLEV